MLDNSAERLTARLAKWTAQGSPDECWPWLGSLTSNGYGRLRVAGIGLLGAHRVALALKLGLPLRGDWSTRHECDSPACVNPAHLLIGDQSDNMADAQQRGRMPRGERNAQARLTAEEVRQIRLEVAGGATRRAVAAGHGVTPAYVGKLASRKAWAWLD